MAISERGRRVLLISGITAIAITLLTVGIFAYSGAGPSPSRNNWDRIGFMRDQEQLYVFSCAGSEIVSASIKEGDSPSASNPVIWSAKLSEHAKGLQRIPIQVTVTAYEVDMTRSVQTGGSYYLYDLYTPGAGHGPYAPHFSDLKLLPNQVLTADGTVSSLEQFVGRYPECDID